MKKIVTLILAVLLAASVASPSFARNYTLNSDRTSALPTINIAGDGEFIYYDNYTKHMRMDSFISEAFDEDNEEAPDDQRVKEIAESIFNVVKPMLMEGVLFGRWDNYYDAMYNEVAEIYDPILLDGNGDPKGDSGLSEGRKDENAYNKVHDNKTGADGRYRWNAYNFWYDWRLDPFQTADELNETIQAIKAVTHKDQVNLISRCLGTSVIFAYITKYGTDDIHGWGIDGSTTNGSEFITGALTGDFDIDGNALARFGSGYNDSGKTDIPQVVLDLFSLLENSGALDGMALPLRLTIYNKIEKGVISALALSTAFTMPSFWAIISADKFDIALENVFGPEGSEKRQTYAGLIEKIENYHNTVGVRLDEILLETKDSGTNVGIVSKYGTNIIPIIKDDDLVSDSFASVTSSSFGATTSRLGETLPEDYIAARSAAGYGAYISPDKQIDASTCLLPDCTWFLKGAQHVDWVKGETDLLMDVVDAETQLTCETSLFSRFLVFSYEDDAVYAMTAENCRTENWDDAAVLPGNTLKGRITAYFRSLFNFLRSFFDFIKTVVQS